jgi:multidrug resistance efflux pump
MELLLLLIYSFFVWLIFFKFKWLPWNITSQVIVVTIPIFAMAALILTLNILCPSSHDVRTINYVVQVVPRVTGRVIEVPVEPNRPVKRGDVLFKIDPAPFEIQVRAAQANLANLRAKLITAQAGQLSLDEQLKTATGNKDAVNARLNLARMRVRQFTELAGTGAGTKFDLEQAQADVANLEGQLAALVGTEAQVQVQIAAKTPEGEQDQVAQVMAQIGQAEAQIADAQWNLEQTVYYAPANGTIVNLQLRVGAVASQLVMAPVMTFVEDEQWVIALYKQNELRKVAPGNEAEIAMSMYPGRIIKCKVDSIMWATAQGQLPMGGIAPDFGAMPVPPGRIAVRLLLDGKDKDLFLAAGARGQGAIYTEHGQMIHILRKVILRVGSKFDWFIFKLH